MDGKKKSQSKPEIPEKANQSPSVTSYVRLICGGEEVAELLKLVDDLLVGGVVGQTVLNANDLVLALGAELATQDPRSRSHCI